MSEGTWVEYSHQQCTCEAHYFLGFEQHSACKREEKHLGTKDHSSDRGKEERPGHEVANDCGGLWGVQDQVT